MPRSLALNEAGQHVSLWHGRLRAAIERWEQEEPERETLRKMVSELEFPPLMAPPMPDGDPDEGALEYAHVDQVNVNLMLRYVNKLKAHAGDEMPRITVPRAEGREKIANLEDVLLQRVMGEAGAPEANLESVGYHCTDGNCAYWVFMPELPSAESLIQGVAKSMKAIVEEALQGVAEPMPGQDYAAIARALVQAAVADPTALQVEDATTDPGAAGPSQLLFKAAEKFAEAADKEAKNPNGWRYEKGKVQVESQILGKYGTLIDPLACDLKDARWVARRITMTASEADKHDSLHPKARKHLKPDPIDERDGGITVRVSAADQETMEAENGVVVIYEIWDRENFARYYVNLGVNLYLQADEEYPYVNEDGDSIIKPIGTHPGFFPVVCEPVLKPVRRSPDQILGTPILKPGIPQQLEIIKLVSAYLGAVKRASAGVYLHRLDPEMAKWVKLAIDGTMLEVDESIEKLGEALQAVEWKAPPHELFLQIDKEISRFAITMNFPLAEITSQPAADTATQEQMGLSQGNLGISEILRRFEVLYAHQVQIARAFVQHYYPEEHLVQVGGMDALAVKQAWMQLGVVPELPAVKLAARAKEQNPVRVRQLIELYNVASQQVDPMTGFPKYDVDHLLHEAATTLGMGKLPRMEITPEMLEARMAQQETGEDPEGGGGPPAPSKEGEGESAGNAGRKKPHPDGAEENSAAQRTDT